MLSSIFLSAAAGLVAVVGAQSVDDNGYSWNTTEYAYSLNSTLWALATDKADWCGAQQNSCYQICDNRIDVNYCNYNTNTGEVEWGCECMGFTTPNITLYDQTVIYHECDVYRNYCINNTLNDGAANRACADIPCPTMDPAAAMTSVSESLASATPMPSSTTSATGAMTTVSTTTVASAAATTTGAAAPLYDASLYGSGLFVAGLVGVLGVAL